jgi:hypothetical protein
LIEHESQASVRKLPDRKALYRENLEQFLDRWESTPLGSTPLVDSIGPETFKANQEHARTAVIWIRRMLEAREEARDSAARLESDSKPKKRRYWLISRS